MLPKCRRGPSCGTVPSRTLEAALPFQLPPPQHSQPHLSPVCLISALPSPLALELLAQKCSEFEGQGQCCPFTCSIYTSPRVWHPGGAP